MTESQANVALSIQAVSALLTLLAVVVALFGDVVRRRLFPPRIRMHLSNKAGIIAPVIVVAPTGAQRHSSAAWHHVTVVNARRWSTATHTQVYLLSIEEPDAGGEFSAVWAGEIPLKWRHAEGAFGPRSVGPASEIDLCSVIQAEEPGRGKWIELHPVIRPSDMRSRACDQIRWRVTLQARSVEADSAPLRIDISWDGRWADDRAVMARHLVVRQVA